MKEDDLRGNRRCFEDDGEQHAGQRRQVLDGLWQGRLIRVGHLQEEQLPSALESRI